MQTSARKESLDIETGEGFRLRQLDIHGHEVDLRNAGPVEYPVQSAGRHLPGVPGFAGLVLGKIAADRSDQFVLVRLEDHSGRVRHVGNKKREEFRAWPVCFVVGPEFRGSASIAMPDHPSSVSRK